MKHKDGRKALVVFSDGVDRGSKDTLNDAIDAADHANLAIYTIYFKGEEDRSEGIWFSGGGGHHGGSYPGISRRGWWISGRRGRLSGWRRAWRWRQA